MRAFESGEAHVAGRVGLVVAVGDHLAAGPDRVRERLGAWAGRPGSCSTASAAGGSSSRSTSRPRRHAAPPDGVDVVATRTRLLAEHGIVTSAIGPERAPGEMTGPVLRVSPHLDATLDDLEALAAAL